MDSSPEFTISRSDCPLVQVEGWPASFTAFETALSRALAMSLPVSVGETVRQGGVRVVRIAPQRFWLLYDAPGAPPIPIDPELGTSLDLGEGRVTFRLSGARLADVLAECIAVDWSSPAAAPGRAVQTGFHRVPVLFVRTSEAGCDLIAPRSFAASLMDWIAASRPDRRDLAG